MKISLLKDKFNSLDYTKWTVDGTPLFSGSGVELTDSYLYSIYSYELTSSSIFVELITLANVSSSGVAILAVLDESVNLYAVGVLDNGIDMRLFTYDGVGDISTEGDIYNSSIHKFFRIRELNSTLYFEHSADLKTWHNITDPINNPSINLNAVSIFIGAGIVAEPIYESVTVDNLNISNTPIINRKYPIVSFKQE